MTSMIHLHDEVLHTLSYFHHFKYPPTLVEMKRYLRISATTVEIERALALLVKRGKVFRQYSRVALSRSVLDGYQIKNDNSKQLIMSVQSFLPVLSWIPSIRLLALSGSLSMEDNDEDGDVDLFLVTTNNSMWLTRSFVLGVTRLLTIIGSRVAAKLCWNMIIDESHLSMPPHKRNEYTAHEILQLKPLIDRRNTYERLLTKNSWISQIFPNVQINSKKNYGSYGRSKKDNPANLIENIFRFFQLKWLEKKGFKIKEYEGQVWYIQEDAEKQIPVKLKRVK